MATSWLAPGDPEGCDCSHPCSNRTSKPFIAGSAAVDPGIASHDDSHVARPRPLRLCKIACTESNSGTGALELLLLLLIRADLCRRLVSSVLLCRCCRYTSTPPATTPSVAANAEINRICKPGDTVRSIQHETEIHGPIVNHINEYALRVCLIVYFGFSRHSDSLQALWYTDKAVRTPMSAAGPCPQISALLTITKPLSEAC